MGHFGVIDGESTYKRDSVIRPLTDPDGWPSIYAVYLGIGRAALPRFDLAPGGVCRAARVAPDAGALLPHRFTLT